MSYEAGYMVFGALFVSGTLAYWVVTRLFRDPQLTYTSGRAPEHKM